MYELIILSLLMRSPAHGYLIAKIINDMFGPYTKISNGRLYPLLAELEKDGLIAQHVENAHLTNTEKYERHLRSYKISEEGRKRFHKLMMDTTSNPGEYQRIFLHKASVLEFLKPTECLYLIDHYINYCQTHVLHIAAEQEDLATCNHLSPSQLKATLAVMQHIDAQWRLELQWAKQLHEQAITDMEFEKTQSIALSTNRIQNLTYSNE